LTTNNFLAYISFSVEHLERKMSNNLNTVMLRQLFRDLMSQTGRPLERLQGVSGRRGPVKEIYRMPNGQTVRLRTNRKRTLMTKADGPGSDDVLNFEGQQDFIGLVIPGPRDSVECFLVPSDVAVEALRASHREWLSSHPGSTSDVRAIHFDGDAEIAWEGFSEKWASYRLAAATPATRSNLEQVIADSRRAIAAAAGKPESAVSISIAF
jgi:hypothetical protein